MSWADAIHREWAEEHRRAELWPEDLPDFDPAYDTEDHTCPQWGGRGYVHLWGEPGEGVEECDRCDGEGTVEVRL